jgi:excisionase family DNA binding protein
MNQMDCFESRVTSADFFTIELSHEFRNHLVSLHPKKEGTGIPNYDRSYGNMHILIEVMNEVYAVYLKDYNFGHIKPLGECIYEVVTENYFADYTQKVSDVILPDLKNKIAFGEIDMDRELYDYYHILPDAYIPFIEDKISDYKTVGEAAKLLGVSDARVKKMVSDRVLDGFKRDGRVYLSKADVEQRKEFIDTHGKPTKSSSRKSGEI